MLENTKFMNVMRQHDIKCSCGNLATQFVILKKNFGPKYLALCKNHSMISYDLQHLEHEYWETISPEEYLISQIMLS